MALALRAATAGTQSEDQSKTNEVGRGRPLADHQHGREHADNRDTERAERNDCRRQAPHDRKPRGASDTDADNTGNRGRQ